MIINCECGKKKFNVNSNLIPEEGRLLKCGSCSKIWHYTPPSKDEIDIIKEDNINEVIASVEENVQYEKENNTSQNLIIKKENKEIPKSRKIENTTNEKSKSVEIKPKEPKVKKLRHKNNKKILDNIIIIIITFIAIIILIDTFKNTLSTVLPGIIPILDSLYETLIDLKLFLKDFLN